IGFQVTLGRLLDVLHAVERGRRLLAEAVQEVDEIIDVGAALVEVEGIEPARDAAPGLRFGRAALDAENTIEVQSGSSPLSLILRCVRPLKAIHSGRVSGRPSPIGLLTSAPV